MQKKYNFESNQMFSAKRGHIISAGSSSFMTFTHNPTQPNSLYLLQLILLYIAKVGRGSIAHFLH